jgi:hypothetical protein
MMIVLSLYHFLHNNKRKKKIPWDRMKVQRDILYHEEEIMVETMAEVLNVTQDSAKKVLDLIHGVINPEKYNSVKKWINACYNKPDSISLKMCAINEEISTCGVEPFYDCDGDVVGIYCNVGDSYISTIFYCYHTKRFVIASFADFIEGGDVITIKEG